MPRHNAAEKRAARKMAEELGIPYAEALRRVREAKAK